MTDYTEMPLDTEVREGDRITFTWKDYGRDAPDLPGQVGTVYISAEGRRTVAGLWINVRNIHITKIERPAPVLPTAFGSVILIHAANGVTFDPAAWNAVAWGAPLDSEGPTAAREDARHAARAVLEAALETKR